MSARKRFLSMMIVAAVTAGLMATATSPVSAHAPADMVRGARGADVVDLQSRLAEVGFDPGPIDGVFGSRTEAAVRAFQGSASLPVTGRVDTITWNALDDTAATTPLMRFGDRGEDVRDLQRRLAEHGYRPGPLDGAFGPLTAAAVRRFQQAVSLAITGSVDQATWDRLAGGGILLRRGDRSDRVDTVQRSLARIGHDPGPADGKFGPRTESAVRAFQSAAGIAVTGTVDKTTWDAIARADTGPGETLFSRGDRGAGVLDLQTRLQRVGFTPGSLDGAYGSRTAGAVARFQRTFNLEDHGNTDEATLDRLTAFEADAALGYAAGYQPGGGASQWRDLVGEVFARWGLDEKVCVGAQCIPSQVDAAIVIIDCESRGVPFVVNVSSGVTGLFQHRLVYWPDRVRRVKNHFPDFPSSATPYDPEHNAMVAALLVFESRGALIRNLEKGGSLASGPHPWSHWSCRRHLS